MNRAKIHVTEIAYTKLLTFPDRPDVSRSRAQWRNYQSRIGTARLVFVDETRAETDMTRSCGRARNGEPLVAKALHSRQRTLTFLAALRHGRIEASCRSGGPINGELFRVYVEQVLLAALAPGDVVVLDNLGSHKAKAVRNAIRAVGAKLISLPK